MVLTLKSPADVQDELRERLRKRRLALNLTQAVVAKRSGVSLPSVRRFEQTGFIALEALLKITLVLECLGDFDKVAADDLTSLAGQPLDSVLAQSRNRGKGRAR